MNLRRLIALISLTGLVACSKVKSPASIEPAKPLAPIVFHADTWFDGGERYAIQNAANIWCLQTSCQADIRIVWDLDFDSMSTIEKADRERWNVIIKTSSEDPTIRDGVLGWTTASGVHNPWDKPVTMALVSDRLDGIYSQVVLHEMGHALGLPHVGTPAGIMYPSIQPVKHVCLRQPDLAAFCEVNVCEKPVYPCED